eukprot:scaffold5_cov331-Pavlova_lutheri.AAC.81
MCLAGHDRSTPDEAFLSNLSEPPLFAAIVLPCVISSMPLSLACYHVRGSLLSKVAGCLPPRAHPTSPFPLVFLDPFSSILAVRRKVGQEGGVLPRPKDPRPHGDVMGSEW